MKRTGSIGSRCSTDAIGGRRASLSLVARAALIIVASCSPESDPAPPQAIQRPALAGLVAAYGFEEASGTTATDSSGNNFTGTLSGPTRVDGYFGKALQFDGVDDLVTVPDANALDLSTGMTISAWVSRETTTGAAAIAVKERSPNPAYGLYASNGNGKPILRYRTSQNAERISEASAVLPVQQWMHVAATFSGTSLKVYLDGVLSNSTTGQGNIVASTGVLRIGGNSAVSEFFKGRLDEVRIYNRALSVSEIAIDRDEPVVANTALTACATPSCYLVAGYGFEEPSGNTVTDSTGHGLTGTVTEAARVAGKFGNGLSFDGVNDRVSVTADALNLPGGMTLSAWVNPAVTSNTWRSIILKEAGTGVGAYGLYAATDTGKPSAYFRGTADRELKAGTQLPANQWSHLTATYDGITLRLYVNGTQVGSQTITDYVMPSSEPLSFGSNASWPGEAFQGRIDEVRIYRRALTAAQIMSDKDAPVAAICGNQMIEGMEVCDGTAAGMCSYGCTSSCTCASGGNFNIDTRGYLGRLCIGSLCTQEGVGGQVPFSVPPGTYTMGAPFTGPLAGESATLGTVTIRPDGKPEIPMGSTVGQYFDFDVGMSTFRAKVATVNFQFEGSPMAFTFSGVGSASNGNPNVTLLVRRAYTLNTNYAWDPVTGGGGVSPTGYGLSINDTGSDVILDQGGSDRYFDKISPLVVRPKWVDVKVTAQHPDYPTSYFNSALGFYGIASAGHNGSIKLLRGRKYWLSTSYSLSLDRNDGFYSVAPDLYIDGTGPAPTLVLEGNAPQMVTADNATLTLNMTVKPVTIDFRGASVPNVAIYGIGAFTLNGPTVLLQVGRRYALATPWAQALEPRTDTGLSTGYPVFEFGVGYQGNSLVVDTEIANSLAPVENMATARVVLSNVTIDPNGYGGQLCISNVGCVQGGPAMLRLMAGRRYTIPGAGTLSVVDASTCSTAPSPLVMGGSNILIQCAEDNPFVTVDVNRDMGGVQVPLETGTVVDLYQGTNLVASVPTDATGKAAFVLPGTGPYRFHTSWWNAHWWSSTSDDCSPWSCPRKAITVSGVEVTVKSLGQTTIPDVAVDGYTGEPAWSTLANTATTGATGIAQVGLPTGLYRFKTTVVGLDSWSADCSVPTCAAVTVQLTASRFAMFQAVAVAPGQVNLTWTDRLGGAPMYRLQRSLNNRIPVTIDLPGTVTSYTDTDVAPSSAFDYVIAAIGAPDESARALARVTTPAENCFGKPNGFSCSDENPCNGPETCQGQKCAGGQAITCGSGEACDTTSGLCVAVPSQYAAMDVTAALAAGTYVMVSSFADCLQAQSGQTVLCVTDWDVDGTPDAYYNAAGQVIRYVAPFLDCAGQDPGTVCGDPANKCMVSTCANGACLTEPRVCEDHDDETLNECDPDVGCTFPPRFLASDYRPYDCETAANDFDWCCDGASCTNIDCSGGESSQEEMCDPDEDDTCTCRAECPTAFVSCSARGGGGEGGGGGGPPMCQPQATQCKNQSDEYRRDLEHIVHFKFDPDETIPPPKVLVGGPSRKSGEKVFADLAPLFSAEGPNQATPSGHPAFAPASTGAPIRPERPETARSSDPVTIEGGELLIEHTDLAFPGTAVPFALVRTYRSRANTRSFPTIDFPDGLGSMLGNGWDHSYNQRLYVDADQAGITLGTGAASAIYFRRTGASGPTGSVPVYTAPARVTMKLLFDPAPAGAPPLSNGLYRYRLIESSGIERLFDEAGLLRVIRDQNHVGLTVNWHQVGDEYYVDAVTLDPETTPSHQRRVVNFNYETENGHLRLEGVDVGYRNNTTDPTLAQMRVDYEYHPTGDLKFAIDSSGRVERYRYELQGPSTGPIVKSIPVAAARGACADACGLIASSNFGATCPVSCREECPSSCAAACFGSSNPNARPAWGNQTYNQSPSTGTSLVDQCINKERLACQAFYAKQEGDLDAYKEHCRNKLGEKKTPCNSGDCPTDSCENELKKLEDKCSNPGTIAGECGQGCLDSCKVQLEHGGCPVKCDEACSNFSVDDVGDLCTAACEEANLKAGAKYGLPRDLNHNIIEVQNANLDLVVKINYHQDLNKPSFDTVESQTVFETAGSPAGAGRTLSMNTRLPAGFFSVDHRTLCPGGSSPAGTPTFVARIVDYTDPYGHKWVYNLDGAANKLSEQNLSTGAIRRYDYDKAGRLIGAKEPGGAYTCFKWTAGEVDLVEHYPAANGVGETGKIATDFTWYNFGEASPLYGLKMSRLGKVVVDGQKHLDATYNQSTGNLELLKSPTGGFTTFQNYSSGQPGLITTPNFAQIELEYRYGVLSKQTTKDILEAAPQVGTIVEELVSDVAGRPTMGTAPLGEVTGWNWESNRLESVTVRNVDTAGGGGLIDATTTYTYDIENRVRTQSDGRKTVTFSYDLADSVRQVEVESLTENLPKQVTCFVNGPDGRRLGVKGPDGNLYGFVYDGEGRLTKIRVNDSADSQALVFGPQCPTPGGLVSGVVLEMDYDVDGRVKEVRQGVNERKTITYDGHGRAIAVKDAKGATVVQGFNKQGSVLWRAVYDALASYTYEKPTSSAVPYLIGMEEFEYTTDGRVQKRHQWSFSRTPTIATDDENLEDQGKLTWSYVYNDGLKTVTVTDPMGREIKTTFDAQGRVRKVEGPEGSSTVAIDMSQRRVDTTTDFPNAAGKLQRRVNLTSWGAVLEVLEGTQRAGTRLVNYDNFKRVRSDEQEGSGKSVFTYDDFGRSHTVERLNAGSRVSLTTIAWDPRFNQVQSRTDESPTGLPAITSYSYDYLGRLKELTRPGGGRINYCYKGLTALVAREAGPGKTVRVNSYGSGDLLKTVEAGHLSSVVAFGEDVCQLPLEAPRFTPGLVKTFAYDGLGRVFGATRSRPEGSPDPGGFVNTQLRWNSEGDLIRETMGDIDARVIADAPTLGTRTWRMKPSNGGSKLDVQEMRDPIGRLTFIRADDPSGGSLGSVSQQYYGFGPVKYRTFANDTSTSTFEFNDLGRLTALAESGPSLETRWDWTVPLDGVPRRSILQRPGGTRTSVFHLDDSNRLLGEDQGVPAGGGPNLSGIGTITPTALANQVTSPWFAGPIKPEARTYELDGRANWKSRNTASETLLPMPNVLDVYTTAYGSDGNTGNLISYEDPKYGNQTFAYDALGNLRSATGSYGTKEYVYDAFDRLVQETKTPSGSPPVIVTYGHLGTKRFLRKNQDGSYRITIDGDGVDDHLMEVSTSATGVRQLRHYHQDASGSVYMMTDQDGTPLEFYDYTAYGEQSILGPDGVATRATSAIENNLGFQGHPIDPDTGLVQMRNRWYLPQLGRFTSTDPLGLAGGPNLFAFAGSAPLKYTDPFGLTKANGLPHKGALRVIWDKISKQPWNPFQLGMPSLIQTPEFVRMNNAEFWPMSDPDMQYVAKGPGERLDVIGLEDLSRGISRVWDPRNDTDLGEGWYDIGSGVFKLASVGLLGTQRGVWSAADRLRQIEGAPQLLHAVERRAGNIIRNQSIRARGPVLSGARDPLTGEIFFGQNTGIPEDLHPLLRQRLNALNEATGGAGIGKGLPGGHSELNALDQALKAYEAASGQTATEEVLGDFLMYNVRLRGAAQGAAIAPCANCSDLTRGVRYIIEQ
jgi:RHS repeat-associated protein